MPVPIEKVENHKYKSWKDSSNLQTAQFNQTNIIFGHNGAGKSSLAFGIANTYLANNSKDTARFFSGKYVESTLLLEDKSGIRGVVSNFGKKDVDIEKKVANNREKIDGLTADIDKQSTINQDLANKTEGLIKEIVKRRKDKNTKINNKPENKTIQEKIALWVKDYEDAHRVFPSEDYNAITGNADFSAESEQINLLSFPEMPELDNEMYTELTIILGTKYTSIDVPEYEVVSWLQGGLHIHEGKKQCEFCGSDIDIETIRKRVDAYLNDEKHKATVKLETYKKSLLEFHEVAKSLIDSKDTFNQVLGLADNEEGFDDVAMSMVQILAFVNESIDRKVKDMDEKLTVKADDLRVSITNIHNAIEALENAKKHSTKAVTEKINRLETLVKGAIGLEIKNSNAITDNIAKIEATDIQSKELLEQRGKLEGQNNRLLAQKSDLADFAEYLNTVIKDLNLNFNLSPSGKVYTLKQADGSSIKLDDISDGERNLLSLIYFYYEMLGNASGELKDLIRLIIIDDPISSLDDNNKFYITEIIRTILDQKSAQVFVLTHSWDDFCNLSYARNDDQTSLFEIRKDSGISNVYPIGKGRLLKPYVKLYREVNAFRQKEVADIDDDEALHMPNTMRRVLEEYVKFRVDVDFATSGRTGDISKALFREEIANIPNPKKQKLEQLLAICNILSHKANHPKNPTEIHESAKFLIGSIEQHDTFHHLKMRGD